MRRGKGLLVLVAALTLSGCELGPPMSPAECAAADWRVIGFEDGSQGTSASHFGARAQACANAGYTADQTAYAEGHSNGVRRFCRPERGYRLGEEGGSLEVSCPDDLAVAFEDAYREGRRLYGARSEYESAESTLRSLWSEREDLQRKLIANETGLSASTTDADRQRHREEVFRLRNELNQLERRIYEAEYDARVRRDAYERLRLYLPR